MKAAFLAILVASAAASARASGPAFAQTGMGSWDELMGSLDSQGFSEETKRALRELYREKKEIAERAAAEAPPPPPTMPARKPGTLREWDALSLAQQEYALRGMGLGLYDAAGGPERTRFEGLKEGRPKELAEAALKLVRERYPLDRAIEPVGDHHWASAGDVDTDFTVYALPRGQVVAIEVSFLQTACSVPAGAPAHFDSIQAAFAAGASECTSGNSIESFVFNRQLELLYRGDLSKWDGLSLSRRR